MDAEIGPLIEGYIDHVLDGRLMAWVWAPDQPNDALGVDVFVDKIHVGQFSADLPRDDLFGAGKGNGRHGVLIDLRPTLAAHPNRSFTVELWTTGPVAQKFAATDVSTVDAGKAVISISNDKRTRVREFFAGRLVLETLNLKAASVAADSGDAAAASTPKYDLLLQPRVPRAGHDAGGPLRISKYADFVRYRFRADRQFQIDVSQADSCDFIKWYLEFYCVMRDEQRAPLSGHEIAYLNEMIPLAGKKHYLTRATLFFLFDSLPQFGDMDLNSLDSYIGVIYWWSIERARSLFVEDCLVPEQYCAALSSVRELWRTVDFPPSRFMEIFFSRNSYWHFLDLHSSEDRRLLYFVMLLFALERPTYLQYIPRHWMRQFFVAEAGRKPLLGEIGHRVFDFHSPLFEPARFKAAIARAGYDFDAGRSRYLTASGGRLRAAALFVPAKDDMVDVQIIGPFAKASGLGQACRLSAQVLARTGFSYSCYDYDLDNPAPVGFSAEQKTGPLKRARINLLHLNAESIPLAFAFMPDVFSGAYNIGYFFWELSSPASCHSLALELLDEIWVSSEYGVEIYRPHTSRPVTKVGMPYEDVPHVEKPVARAMVESRFGVAPGEFVFFAAFDSFSFVQRKNPIGLIKAFQAAFTKSEKVRLLMKTHNRDFVTDPQQQKIWRAIAEAADTDPRIIVVNETLPYADLITLKTGVDCYVSLHKSEGWGFGMLEAMNLGVPVLATAYSGNTDFCTPETCWNVEFDMEELGTEDYIFVVPGQKWAAPKVDSAAAQMMAVFSDREAREDKVTAAAGLVRSQFSSDAVAARYSRRIFDVLQVPIDPVASSEARDSAPHRTAPQQGESTAVRSKRGRQKI